MLRCKSPQRVDRHLDPTDASCEVVKIFEPRPKHPRCFQWI